MFEKGKLYKYTPKNSRSHWHTWKLHGKPGPTLSAGDMVLVIEHPRPDSWQFEPNNNLMMSASYGEEQILLVVNKDYDMSDWQEFGTANTEPDATVVKGTDFYWMI